ncbi:MAG: hypothetical protein RLY31_3052 [Bacteroidota bacterium]|jgi:hypothetical protein
MTHEMTNNRYNRFNLLSAETKSIFPNTDSYEHISKCKNKVDGMSF